MATQLGVYNIAVRELGEHPLATLTENRRVRREIDAIYTDTIRYCLEMASWNVAMRTVLLEYDSDITTQFGYAFAFSKPDDWVHTEAVSLDEYFNEGLTRYNDEGTYLFADHEQLYLKYVSDGAGYGNDLSAWPESFTDYVGKEIAARLAWSITKSQARTNEIKAERDKAKAIAESRDNQNEPTKFLPSGNWSRARHGGRRSTERAP